MSTHRQHALDIPASPTPIPQAPREAAPRRTRFGWVAVIAVNAALLIAIPLFLRGPANGTPIPPAQIVTTALPPAADAKARLVVDRLRDWRSGYEAALDNGCALRPLLTAPIAGRP
jgi:hypothetical protein